MVTRLGARAATRTVGITLAWLALFGLLAAHHAEGSPVSIRGGSALARCERPDPTTPQRPRREITIPPTQGNQVVQIIKLTLLPGPLKVTPMTVTVPLHWGAGGWLEGTLGPITVVDARGNAKGWTLVAEAEPGTSRGLAVFEPEPPETVWGNSSDVLIGEPGVHKAVLACAPPGGGGGTFKSSARVLARNLDGTRLLVRLTLR